MSKRYQPSFLRRDKAIQIKLFKECIEIFSKKFYIRDVNCSETLFVCAVYSHFRLEYPGFQQDLATFGKSAKPFFGGFLARSRDKSYYPNYRRRTKDEIPEEKTHIKQTVLVTLKDTEVLPDVTSVPLINRNLRYEARREGNLDTVVSWLKKMFIVDLDYNAITSQDDVLNFFQITMPNCVISSSVFSQMMRTVFPETIHSFDNVNFYTYLRQRTQEEIQSGALKFFIIRFKDRIVIP